MTAVCLLLAAALAGCSGASDSFEPTVREASTTPSPTPSASIANFECPDTPLSVEITYVMKSDPNAGLLVNAASNLPDGSELMASFYVDGGAYFAQDSQVLSGGVATFGPFSDDGVPLNGLYEFSITLAIARNQPESVRACIGEMGELMTGPLVGREEISGDFYASLDELVTVS